jgi:hypothetical protein
MKEEILPLQEASKFPHSDMACAGSGDSTGDRSGDLRGAALAGKGAPRPASPTSPLPPLGSKFWALSQSEGGSDDEGSAPVDELALPVVSDGGVGRVPVTLGPFIDRALGSPGWTRAGRGCHGRGRPAGACSAAAAPALSSSCVAPVPDPDPAGSADLSDFPPLPSCAPSAGSAAIPGRAALLQEGEFIFPARSPMRFAGLGCPSILAAGVASGRSSPPLACGPQLSGTQVGAVAPFVAQTTVEKVATGPDGPLAHFPRPKGTLDRSHFFPAPISDLRSSSGGAQIHLPPLSSSTAPPPPPMDRYWRNGRDGRGSYKRPFSAVAQGDHRPIQDYSEEELREILDARSLDFDRRRERQRERSPVRQPDPYRRGGAERYPAHGQANYYRRNYSGGGDSSGPSNTTNKKQKPSPTPWQRLLRPPRRRRCRRVVLRKLI